jgi:hypothetical protein
MVLDYSQPEIILIILFSFTPTIDFHNDRMKITCKISVPDQNFNPRVATKSVPLPD